MKRIWILWCCSLGAPPIHPLIYSLSLSLSSSLLPLVLLILSLLYLHVNDSQLLMSNSNSLYLDLPSFIHLPSLQFLPYLCSTSCRYRLLHGTGSNIHNLLHTCYVPRSLQERKIINSYNS